MTSVHAVIEALEEANRRKLSRVSQSAHSNQSANSGDNLESRLPSVKPSDSFDIVATESEASEDNAPAQNNEEPRLDHFKKFVADKSRTSARRPTHKKFVGQDVAPYLLSPELSETSSSSSPSFSSTSATSFPPTMNSDVPINLGDILRVDTAAGEQIGVVRFLGPTFFANPEVASGEWIGLELDSAEGKNDGSVKGSRYFTCEPLHGIFVQRRVVKEHLGQKAPDISSSEELLPVRTSDSEASRSQEPPKTPNRNWPWVKIKTEGANDPYYWNEETDVTTWLRPESFFEEEAPTPIMSPTGIEAALIQEAMAAQDSGLPSGEKTAAELAAIEWAEKEAQRALSERASFEKNAVEQAAQKAAAEKAASEKLETEFAQFETEKHGATQENLVASVHQADSIRQSPWTAVDSGEGSFYYWNEDTDETTWEKPADFDFEIKPEENVSESANASTETATTEKQATDRLLATEKQEVADKQAAIENQEAKDRQSAMEKEIIDRQVAEEKEYLEKQFAAEISRKEAEKEVSQATESLTIPEPAEEEGDDTWVAVPAGEGNVYYWNRDTDETSWVKPPDFGKKKTSEGSVVVKLPTEQSEVPDVAAVETSVSKTEFFEAPPRSIEQAKTELIPVNWQQTKEDSSDLESDTEVAEVSPRIKRLGTFIAAPTRSPEHAPAIAPTSVLPAFPAFPPPSSLPDRGSDETLLTKSHKRRGTIVEAPTSSNPFENLDEAPQNISLSSAAPSTTPPPPPAKSPWRSTETDDGKVYYWHRVTGETTWTQPADFVASTEADDSSGLDSDEENVSKESNVAVHVINRAEEEDIARKEAAIEEKLAANRRETEELEKQVQQTLQKVEEKQAGAKENLETGILEEQTAQTTPPFKDEAEIVAEAARDLGPWMEVADGNGNVYYWNEETDVTTWEKPAQLVAHEKRAEIAEQALRKVAGEEPAVASTNPFDNFDNNVSEAAAAAEAAAKEAKVAEDTAERLANEKEEERQQLEKEKIEREKAEKEQMELLETQKQERDELEQKEREAKELKGANAEQLEQERNESNETDRIGKEGSKKDRIQVQLLTSLESELSSEFAQANKKEVLSAFEGKNQNDTSLSKDLVPLSNIVDNWLIASSLLDAASTDTEAEGPIHALNAAMSLLKDLWYLDDQTWLRLRHRVKIGVVKDTKLYGNTSVSMGAAKVYGRSHSFVGFLNCGTGGIKYQLYSSQNGPLRLSAEHKPKNGASVHTIKAGSFKPKTVISVEDTRQMLIKELAEAPWLGQEGVPVFAFVTGTLRNYWEEASNDEKAVLEAEVKRLFHDTGIRCLNDTFFLSSEEEGRLELVGCNAMYTNLVGAGLLESGTEVIGSFGIGRGSCQWAIATPEGQVETIAHPAGMADLKGLAGVGHTVLSAYRQPEKLFTLLNSLVNVENPVIALKSGCCLLLERKDYPEIKTQLTAPVNSHVLRRVRVTRNGSNITPEILIWMGASLARFCAEAAYRLKLKGDFPLVYDEHGVIVSDLNNIQFSKLPLLSLAARGEAFSRGSENSFTDRSLISSSRGSQSKLSPPALPAWSDDIPLKMGYSSIQKNAPSALASELSDTFRSASLPCSICQRVSPNSLA